MGGGGWSVRGRETLFLSAVSGHSDLEPDLRVPISGVFPGQNFLLLGISHPIGLMPEIVLIKNLTKCL